MKKTMKMTKHLAAVGLMLFAGFAQAVPYGCSGTPTYLAARYDGGVVTQLGVGAPIVIICNMETQGPFTMTAGACKAAYNTLLVAKLFAMSVQVTYDNAATCTTLTNWGAYPDVYLVSGPN